jgi:glycosyltransferase involved in cell wall biosynthesis
VLPLFLADPPPATPWPGGRRLLFAGRLSAAKGLSTLLRALAAMRVRAELEVCGDGWWQSDARQLVGRLGLDDRVAFNGWLSRRDLAEAFRRATVVVVPSHWPEPFGLVGLEAMAHGRPVVGTHTGGIPEWLSEDVIGRLVPPGDVEALANVLDDLLGDDAACRRYASAGPGHLQTQWTSDRYIAGLESSLRRAQARWQARSGLRGV